MGLALALLIVIFLGSGGQVATARTYPNQYRFVSYSLDDGLSQGTVNSIAQDPTGFIWLGTQDGLNRFDGKTFKIFRNNRDDPNSLSHDWIYFKSSTH